jgi:hypothetical protein
MDLYIIYMIDIYKIVCRFYEKMEHYTFNDQVIILRTTL